MKDIQMERPSHQLSIDWVGICDYSFPIKTIEGIEVIAKISLSTNLSADRRGTHMSRLVHALYEKENILSKEWLVNLAEKIKESINTNHAKIKVEFTYLIKKQAPVSKICSFMEYEVSIEYVSLENFMEFNYKINIPVMTVCPCSKAISKNGAHNQRAIIILNLSVGDYLDLSMLISEIEQCASSELWSLLKRPDEKYVTESSYDSPKFVEDVCRDVAVVLNTKEIKHYEICVTSYESIHAHNAFSYIESKE